ncbi:hypothetical protein PFISCL1PPCAC_7647, partial [Pristionchus fissidentatus]
DLSYSLGVQTRPNFNFAADLGTGAAGAINAATQAFINGLLGIGGSVIDGAAGLGRAGLNGAAGLGGAAAGAASAAGKGAASLGGSIGGSIGIGASGNASAQLQAALANAAATAAGSGASTLGSLAADIVSPVSFQFRHDYANAQFRQHSRAPLEALDPSISDP